MTNTVSDLIREINDHESTLKFKKEELVNIQRKCNHSWNKIEYTPIVHESYTIPEFKMGIDYSPAMYVPREEVKRWSRTCSLCSLTQRTLTTKKEYMSGSIAGTSSEIEVPDFKNC